MNLPEYQDLVKLEDLMRSLVVPKVTVNMVTDVFGVAAEIEVGTETPNLHFVPFSTGEPMTAYVGPYQVVVDPTLENQKMRPSEEFKRIQSPELWESTNQWMREFFGVTYPIQRIGNILIMHPKALRKLHDALGGRSGPFDLEIQ